MRSAPLLVSVLALAACGSGGGGTTASVARTATTACPGAAKAHRHIARVSEDLARLRAAARTGSHAATSTAADRFMIDVAYEPAGRRNRLIDHAAAAVLGVCEDCFQALEAMRPIPAMKYGSTCT